MDGEIIGALGDSARSKFVGTPTLERKASAPGANKTHAASVSSARLLRVLQVTPRYLPYTGGVEHHVYQVSRRLARDGVDVTVLTADPSGQLPPHEIAEGVKIHRVRAWPSNRDYYLAPEIYGVITRGQWDVVHVQSYHTLFAPLAMMAAIRAKIPFVVTFHGGGSSSRLRNLVRGAQRALIRPLLSRADRLVAIARFEVDYYGKPLRIPRERFVYVPDGADLPRLEQRVSKPADHTLIASVARLERYKGHQRVIAALPKVLERRPDVRLWIAGSGPYEEPLKKMAQQLGVADHIDIHAVPVAERQRFAQELARASLMVLLSDYETHPVAVLEALALGVPALVADNSGLRELAEEGLARAIPTESTPEEVAAAILAELEKPHLPADLHLATWDDCAAGLAALYCSVARRQPCVS